MTAKSGMPSWIKSNRLPHISRTWPPLETTNICSKHTALNSSHTHTHTPYPHPHPTPIHPPHPTHTHTPTPTPTHHTPPSETINYFELEYELVHKCLVPCSVTTYDLNNCRPIVNWTMRTNFRVWMEIGQFSYKNIIWKCLSNATHFVSA